MPPNMPVTTLLDTRSDADVARLLSALRHGSVLPNFLLTTDYVNDTPSL
jgi:hypothetical protein